MRQSRRRLIDSTRRCPEWRRRIHCITFHKRDDNFAQVSAAAEQDTRQVAGHGQSPQSWWGRRIIPVTGVKLAYSFRPVRGRGCDCWTPPSDNGCWLIEACQTGSVDARLLSIDKAVDSRDFAAQTCVGWGRKKSDIDLTVCGRWVMGRLRRPAGGLVSHLGRHAVSYGTLRPVCPSRIFRSPAPITGASAWRRQRVRLFPISAIRW